MEPYPVLDKFRLREIEQQLVAELQTAVHQLQCPYLEVPNARVVGSHSRP
jgi:hypothetical protein